MMMGQRQRLLWVHLREYPEVDRHRPLVVAGLPVEIAEREKFDLILQEAVYVSPRLDITDQVVKQLNAGR